MQLLSRAGLAVGRDLRLGNLTDRLASAHGNRLLVTEGGDSVLRLTHAQAAKRVARWAGGVHRQAGPGDRVVVALPNGYEFLLACLAVARAGCIPVPVNPRMRRDEVSHVVSDSGAALVVRHVAEIDGGLPLREPAPGEPGDVAAIFYTSGTTGKPKGARLTNEALVGRLGAAAAWPTHLRRDQAVLSLPVAHIMGFVALLGLACAGIPAHLVPRFDAEEILDAIEQKRASIFVGVPAMYRMLMEAGAEERDLRSVRMWISGADTMPPGLARRFKQLGATVTLPLVGRSLGEAAFVDGYGMVELGGGVAARLSPPGLSLGLGAGVVVPLPGNRLRVVDGDGLEVAPGEVGELLVKGAGVLEAYHGNEEATREAVTDDGWLRTGDLARRGAFGTVVLAGRKKDVIMHGGYSVFAAEVEAAVERHPDVVEAAVVGLGDERMGEVPVAAVRLRPGSELTVDELMAWAHGEMAGYKRPQQIVVVDDLPRTGTSKVQKDALRGLFDVGSEEAEPDRDDP